MAVEKTHMPLWDPLVSSNKESKTSAHRRRMRRRSTTLVGVGLGGSWPRPAPPRGCTTGCWRSGPQCAASPTHPSTTPSPRGTGPAAVAMTAAVASLPSPPSRATYATASASRTAANLGPSPPARWHSAGALAVELRTSGGVHWQSRIKLLASSGKTKALGGTARHLRSC